MVFGLLGQNMIGALSKHFQHHVHYVVDMRPTLEGGDAIDKADLLEVLIRGDTYGYLPPKKKKMKLK